MKKIVMIAAFAAAASLVSSPALAGPTYLWGQNAKGKTAKAGKYGGYTRIYTPAEHAKLKKSAKKRYSQKAQYCGKPFMVSKAQLRFIAAHKKAKHAVVVRERIAKGKYKKHCNA